MGYKLRTSRDAAAQLLNALDDEASCWSSLTWQEVSIRFTAHAGDIQSALTDAHASGLTAMLDAIDAGLAEMKKAKNSRKALVIVSDGATISASTLPRRLSRWCEKPTCKSTPWESLNPS